MPNTFRPIKEIAGEIVQDWKKPNYAAVPYLKAMLEINSITDMYYADSGRSIVSYFLSNATTWRGQVARRIKKELQEMSRYVG